MIWFNYFLFLIPPLIWNILFSRFLPNQYFLGKVPRYLERIENFFRIGAMATPFFIPIDTTQTHFEFGLYVYVIGMIVYFISWILQIKGSFSLWSSFRIIRYGPAWTPVIWFSGITIMSAVWWYEILVIGFCVIHLRNYAQKFNSRLAVHAE